METACTSVGLALCHYCYKEIHYTSKHVRILDVLLRRHVYWNITIVLLTERKTLGGGQYVQLQGKTGLQYRGVHIPCCVTVRPSLECQAAQYRIFLQCHTNRRTPHQYILLNSCRTKYK